MPYEAALCLSATRVLPLPRPPPGLLPDLHTNLTILTGGVPHALPVARTLEPRRGLGRRDPGVRPVGRVGLPPPRAPDLDPRAAEGVVLRAAGVVALVAWPVVVAVRVAFAGLVPDGTPMLS